jgi:hypothetical protein
VRVVFAVTKNAMHNEADSLDRSEQQQRDGEKSYETNRDELLRIGHFDPLQETVPYDG